jgi:uncharacterized repeat protein (TIGR03803 family)
MTAVQRTYCRWLTVLALALTILSAESLLAKETILHKFSSERSGASPYALVSDSSGNLFGTTQLGGLLNLGTVFELSPKPGGGWSQTVLHSFAGGTDGATPSRIVLDAAGNIYGITEFGGTGNCSDGGCGTAFKLSRNSGAQGFTYNVIYRFSDGLHTDVLLLDNAGNLYGSAENAANVGVSWVFELTPSGSSWTETILYTFSFNTVNYPSGLVFDDAGNLYGALSGYESGLVFELLPSSGGSWTEKTVYTFRGVSGADPTGSLIFRNGNLYGTTQEGGNMHCLVGGRGCGVVFQLQPGSNGQWTESVLFKIPGTPGNSLTNAGLSGFDSSGNLYGWAQSGGSGACNYCGLVFELTESSDGSWAENDLWNFTGQNDGEAPSAVALGPTGQLFGANAGSLLGMIFELTPKPSDRALWSLNVLYSFPYTDGENPNAGLVSDAAGNLYGTTDYGGINDTGSVFQMTPSGNGWKENMIYSFGPAPTQYTPLTAGPSGLVVDSMGNLYGTAAFGGANRFGSVVELSYKAGIGWQETDLFSFSDVAHPMGGIIFDPIGHIYGVTFAGGAHGFGSVFQLTRTPGGAWQKTVIYDFNGYPNDGANPAAGLAIDSAGNLYGTTKSGGSGDCSQKSIAVGCGTVFELSKTASGWNETILHSFLGAQNRDGSIPMANLIFDGAGNIYGTTYNGGVTDYLCGGTIFVPGCGTVFELSPVNGQWNETVLHEFVFGASEPLGGLVLDQSGNLYGMTEYGGAYYHGTLFKLSPAAGEWESTVIHNFGSGSDGFYPAGSPIMDSSGNLYGVTLSGGIEEAFDFYYGSGTVFEIAP